MAARGPPGAAGEEGRLTDEPEATAPEPEPADLESGPDSAPEVRGEAGRGEACSIDDGSVDGELWSHLREAGGGRFRINIVLRPELR